MSQVTMVIASDHAGLELKAFITQHLKNKHIEVEDLGPHSPDSVDYPDYAQKLCERVLKNSETQGILICGTGVGMSIAANKVHGIRAALVFTPFMATMAKVHNNANVLCLGARVVDQALAWELVQSWMGAKFEGGRHEARLQKVLALEKKT